MDTNTNKKTLPKKAIVQSIALLAAAVCIVAGFYGTTEKAKAKETDETLHIQGSIKLEEVTLNSKIAGNVAQVVVKEGDQIKAGDPIIIIDSSSIQAKKMQAEGALAAARAQASKAANGARSQEVAQAKASADYAQKTYDRVKTLYEQGAIPANTYDETYAKYTAAQETYNMALEGARSEDISAASALVTQAEGALAEVNSYLADCVIKAPADGTVTSINIEQGELVSTGMALATMSGNGTPWVEVSVPETLLSHVSVGSSVPVALPAYQGKEFTGKISKVGQKPDFATKRATANNGDFDVLSYTVTVTLDSIDANVYSGMTALVDFSEKAGK